MVFRGLDFPAGGPLKKHLQSDKPLGRRMHGKRGEVIPMLLIQPMTMRELSKG
jgi:hypothetical protein